MNNEQRIAFSKQWAALKNFDKDVDKYTRNLENEIAELRNQIDQLDRKKDDYSNVSTDINDIKNRVKAANQVIESLFRSAEKKFNQTPQILGDIYIHEIEDANLRIIYGVIKDLINAHDNLMIRLDNN